MIRNYNEIEIIPYSLVILDIDETILSFSPITRNWWNDMKKTHTDDYAYLEWVKIISENEPYLLDEQELFKLIDKINRSNSKLIFLTARNSKFQEITFKQLVYCGLSILRQDIYFSDKKGITVYDLKRKYTHSHVIFVDDRISNVLDVSQWNPDVKCYHLNHINL